LSIHKKLRGKIAQYNSLMAPIDRIVNLNIEIVNLPTRKYKELPFYGSFSIKW